MKQDTLLIKTGIDIEKYSGSVNPPIYNSSSILFKDIEAYNNAVLGISPYTDFDKEVVRDYSYGSDTNPTLKALSQSLSILEVSKNCSPPQTLIFPSGLSALVQSILALVSSGENILLPQNAYWRLKKFLQYELIKFNITFTVYNIHEDLKNFILPNTKLIILESPVSYTFEVTDIVPIVALAKSHNIITLIDNSWASPLYFKPLNWGIDVAIYSGTKYLSGYSDIRMGVVSSFSEYFPLLYKSYCNYGINVSGYECYLAYRSLKTLALRLERHYQSALKLAQYFNNHPKIAQILYPPLPSNPFYPMWEKYFLGGGGLLSIVLKDTYNKTSLARMLNFTDVFKIGASWGGYQSLVLPLDVNKLPGASSYKDKLLRLYCGLENINDLLEDFEKALTRL